MRLKTGHHIFQHIRYVQPHKLVSSMLVYRLAHRHHHRRIYRLHVCSADAVPQPRFPSDQPTRVATASSWTSHLDPASKKTCPTTLSYPIRPSDASRTTEPSRPQLTRGRYVAAKRDKENSGSCNGSGTSGGAHTPPLPPSYRAQSALATDPWYLRRSICRHRTPPLIRTHYTMLSRDVRASCPKYFCFPLCRRASSWIGQR